MPAYFLSAQTSSPSQVELSSESFALHPPNLSPSLAHTNITLLHPQSPQHNSTFNLRNRSQSESNLIKIHSMQKQAQPERVKLKYSR